MRSSVGFRPRPRPFLVHPFVHPFVHPCRAPRRRPGFRTRGGVFALWGGVLILVSGCVQGLPGSERQGNRPSVASELSFDLALEENDVALAEDPAPPRNTRPQEVAWELRGSSASPSPSLPAARENPRIRDGADFPVSGEEGSDRGTSRSQDAGTLPTLPTPQEDVSTAQAVDAESPELPERLAAPATDVREEPQTLPLPARTDADSDPIQLSLREGRLSVQAVDASLDALLGMIAEQQGLNIVSGELQDQRITVTLQNVALPDALDTILAVKGYTWSQQNNIIVVSQLGGEGAPALLQGREVRVYNLNYISAADIEGVVKGLLSQAGQVFINETDTANQRQTHEQLVVEDTSPYLDRVERYLEQADIPPKQVVVEAHVLQVTLQDDLRHGVEFDHMLRLAGSEVSLESSGLASEQGPTTMLRLQGTDLDGLIEAIKTNTDAKTLASPKVAVLNGQQARMQVGGQIGYLLTTTTQTSTLESVDFLDVGVILSVTPLITEDQQVLLDVRPQVSTGRINSSTNLPESETTEIETKVMLGDGEALVIGGLIQETDNLSETKVPWLGDLRGVGRLFQKREIHRERSEIIIALVPRILHPMPDCRELDVEELQRATTPLMHGPLHPNNRRRWEPQLPSAQL